jgi:hypothetical protein
MSDSLGETTHQAEIIPIATDHPEAVISALITTSADLLLIDAGNPRCPAPGPSGVASRDSTARC